MLPGHLSQEDITSRKLSFDQIFAAGKRLFDAKFNTLDGQGRPYATGNGKPTGRAPNLDMPMVRTSGPDSNACAGCHNDPRSGAGGDFVANVFVLAQVLDPITYSVDPDFSNERNTLGMMGAGPIELLGREMTRDLHRLRERAKAAAAASGLDVTLPLESKGVSFGSITARPDGTLDFSRLEGVDNDLIIKPFHQKGVVRSLREFTVNAMNHHHGMQAVERFGQGETGSRDFDVDGIEDELSVGDITAATIYQAALNTPGQVLPGRPEARAAVQRGEARFGEIGCAGCHKPQLALENPVFCEPYPLNPKGTFSDASRAYCFDLTQTGEKPRLEKREGKGGVVRAYTDLKRHQICDADLPHFCNERVVQGGVPTGQFITRKLWDAGNSAPYGHRGDLTTLTEAILAHGGEGRSSRDRFGALSAERQAEIIEFLKTLQIVPPGAPSRIHGEAERPN
ncbi:MAG TPA: di-heme oxidoredictase family protein [Candidatus Manganitrophaceae bacterium]|nr:di-heme oxidoredictase family protein [Candidatus Manganitrophaceae bacterium]